MSVLAWIKERCMSAARDLRTALGERPAPSASDSDAFPFYDISWLAVKNADEATIIDVLDLADAAPASWQQGWSAVWGDYWDFDAPLDAHLSRVYITPPLQAWRLAIGGWIGEGGENGLEGVVHYCRTLSQRCGEAHAFTSQNRMGWYSWMLAREGAVYRKYWIDGSLTVDEGSPTLAEQSDDSGGMESLVMAVAGECSLNPAEFLRENIPRSDGLLAITPWGRKHGVPQRPLD